MDRGQRADGKNQENEKGMKKKGFHRLGFWHKGKGKNYKNVKRNFALVNRGGPAG